MADERARILVVDDDGPILLLMKSILKGFGFEPVTAGCGRDAVAAARDERPELILLDMTMPDMSGAAVVEAIRRDAQLDSPVLILSGHRLSREQIEAVGAVGAIQKPFELEVLIREIRHHLAEKPEIR